ncbi:MAG: hypothetical protein E6H52_17685 [Betaproteobacteria bacterium]|nr:MAG: hypothetical protein E6H52_17685 [Betaproteobacteria bacterium]
MKENAMPLSESRSTNPEEPEFSLPRDRLDRRLADLLPAPSTPEGFRQNLWRAIATQSATDLAQRRRALELERARQLNQLEQDYVRMRRDTLAMVLAAALTAGATLSLALPWLAAKLNTDIATLAPLGLLMLALAGVAWIWREPLTNFAWRLVS